ncbi:hypothetical protein EDC54_10232 [Samsonia erythrinae]|uniref:Uncharacterized protein n=1 Tax=Samsonia erythrinae TaxID=160434 RepID=A0A4R3VRK5_9GAMM|nr:hypothetical protein EDC54_10232 [Samsonia erythrinae]
MLSSLTGSTDNFAQSLNLLVSASFFLVGALFTIPEPLSIALSIAPGHFLGANHEA